MSINLKTPSRRDRNKQEVRARLLDSAVRMFAERGYAETAISDIADEAEVSRATAFNYFPRKEDYFFAWAEARRAEVRTVLAAETVAAQDAAMRLLRSFETLADAYEQDARLSRPLTREWLKAGGPLMSRASESSQLVTELLIQGQANGDIRKDVDATEAGFIVLDVYLGTLYRWARAEDDTTLKAPLLRALRLVLSAMRP